MKSRILLLFTGVLILWAMLLTRAAFLQVWPHPRLQSLQKRLFHSVVELQSRRGAILDRSGRELALSQKSYSLYADPKILTAPKSTAKKVARLLRMRTRSVQSKLADKKKRFVWIKRHLDLATYNEIKSWGIRGLSFVEEWKRVYPNESLLAPTIGLVGSEGKGLEGMELSQDIHLRGLNKKVSVKKDARGRPLLADGLMFTETPDGAELSLTIDADLQYNLESELNAAMGEFGADSAVGIVLDAKTSAILALASTPSFDLNKPFKSNTSERRNRVLQDAFEPGSTMKTFVVAAALREKIIAPNSKYHCEDGFMKVGYRVIREADGRHKWGWLSVSEILTFSSNIGVAKIAFDLGAEALQKALLDFGFGSRLQEDLPGESKGIMHSLPWRQHLLANISFGHGMAATPLQMANAYAAIANGGQLMRPYIVQKIKDIEDGQLIETEPQVIRRVMSEEDAARMRLLLTGVTSPQGTGYNARVEGFLVGGKTGTAQKVNPNGRGYLPKSYISSFAGFLPAHDPKYVVYIAVDNPKKKYYGSAVAAPIFSKVASYAVRKAGLTPVLISERNLAPSPLEEQSDSENESKELVQMNLDQFEFEEQKPELMPDLKNMSLREVLKQVQGTDLRVQIRGQGTVSRTSPEAGEALPANRRVRIYLK